MNEVKKIDPASLAKTLSYTMALCGLLFAILYSFGGLIIDTLVSSGRISPEIASTPGLSYGTILAFAALIIMPMIGACIGLLMGIISATTYNLLANNFGGVKGDRKSHE